MVLSPTQVVGIFAIFVACVVGLAMWSARKTRESLVRLAAELGFQFCEGPAVLGIFRSAPTVEGNIGRRAVKFYQYSVGSGKRRRTFSAMSVSCTNPHGLTVRLCAQNLLTEIAEKFGLQDLQVGEPVFDKKFVVQTNDPAYLRAALLPEMREALMAKWPRELPAATLKIEGNSIVFSDAGSFSEQRLITAMKTLLGELPTLAALPEVYAPGR
ncbi:hypothetical protein DB347_24645 [Opitutaceae bacterium EW11]|nr:hypothetical protein DB347_24645 [Opitutaceae bacterium EW11]